MKKIMIAIGFMLAIAACSKNPITGRKQLQLYNEADIQQMATTEYRTFLQQNPPVSPTVSKDAEMVRRVGQRISTAVTQFYTQKKMAKELEGYKWEYNLVDAKDVNAWCMPGGKIVVYTGLLPISQNEAALAVVMGHEVAHALARHGNERMSQMTAQQLGGVAVSVAVSNQTPEAQQAIMQAYGIGTVSYTHLTLPTILRV